MFRLISTSIERNRPDHWSLLSESDKAKYRELQISINPLSFRTARDYGPWKFQIIITHINCFAIRQDGDDWKRCLVCGLVWLNHAIAVNNRQMSLLTGKCKALINDGFQSLGYSSTVMSDATKLSLMDLNPFLARNCDAIRQWTIRELPSVSFGNGDGTAESEHHRSTAVTFKEQSAIETSDSLDDWTATMMDIDLGSDFEYNTG
jgi:hypothetical protein